MVKSTSGHKFYGPVASFKLTRGGNDFLQLFREQGTANSYTDTAGDSFVVSWTVKEMNEKGGPKGVWTMTGGTGRYPDGTVSGTYTDIPSEDPNNQHCRVDWQP